MKVDSQDYIILDDELERIANERNVFLCIPRHPVCRCPWATWTRVVQPAHGHCGSSEAVRYMWSGQSWGKTA